MRRYGSFDFYFLVLPLGVLVFISASIALYYVRREERAQRRLTKLRLEQKEIHDKQLQQLQELAWVRGIDEATLERMKKLMESDYSKKRNEVLLQLPSSPSKDGSSTDTDIQDADTTA